MPSRLPLILVGLLMLAGLAGLFLLSDSGRDRRLDASVIGVDALQPWLVSQGLPTERSNPRIRPDIAALSLRILPLYDTDLDSQTADPKDSRAAYYATSLRDIYRADLQNRANGLPMMVAMPKWVAGTVVSSVAHDSALIPLAELDRLTGQMGLGRMRMIRPQPGLMTARVEGGEIALFQPQLIATESLPDICKPTLELPKGTLLADCYWPGSASRMHVLADPDLLNNHGLTLGDNAVILAQLVKTIAAAPVGGPDKNTQGNTAPVLPERRVYIDTSDRDLVSYYDYAEERHEYDRSGNDLARFFAPPLAGLWAMLLIVLAVALWRGSVRFGPARPEAFGTPEQSKTTAIETNARLLRIAGHDSRLVADHVQATLADLARDTFGRGPGSGAQGIERLFGHLERRDPANARALRLVAAKLADPAETARPQDLRRHFETFRHLLENLTHVH